MSSSCTAPIRGHEPGSAAEAECPKCGPRRLTSAHATAAALVPPTAPVNDHQAEQALLATGILGDHERHTPAGLAADAAQRGWATDVISDTITTAKAICPSVRSLVWYPNDGDDHDQFGYDGLEAVEVRCDHTGLGPSDRLQDFAEAHDLPRELAASVADTLHCYGVTANTLVSLGIHGEGDGYGVRYVLDVDDPVITQAIALREPIATQADAYIRGFPAPRLRSDDGSDGEEIREWENAFLESHSSFDYARDGGNLAVWLIQNAHRADADLPEDPELAEAWARNEYMLGELRSALKRKLAAH